MPGLLQHRIALVAAAAVISGAAATAVAVAFPGRAAHAPIVAADQGIVATPTPYIAPATPSPTPSPTPTPTEAPVTRRASSSGGSTTTTRAAPTSRPSGGGSPDCSAMPGPACKAVTNPPDQPGQPQPPEQP